MNSWTKNRQKYLDRRPTLIGQSQGPKSSFGFMSLTPTLVGFLISFRKPALTAKEKICTCTTNWLSLLTNSQIFYRSGSLINGDNWYLNLLRARHLEPHARFVRPSCIHSRGTDATPPSTSPFLGDQLALYVSISTFFLSKTNANDFFY